MYSAGKQEQCRQHSPLNVSVFLFYDYACLWVGVAHFPLTGIVEQSVPEALLVDVRDRMLHRDTVFGVNQDQSNFSIY